MSGGKYEQAYDGEWFELPAREFWQQCCDCGLVHRWQFRIVRRGWRFAIRIRLWREPRATGGARAAIVRQEKDDSE